MKKTLGIMLVASVIALGVSSCSQQPTCCDCSNTNGLYAGQSDVCYGDNLASQGKDESDWTDWMENDVGCACN